MRSNRRDNYKRETMSGLVAASAVSAVAGATAGAVEETRRGVFGSEIVEEPEEGTGSRDPFETASSIVVTPLTPVVAPVVIEAKPVVVPFGLKRTEIVNAISRADGVEKMLIRGEIVANAVGKLGQGQTLVLKPVEEVKWVPNQDLFAPGSTSSSNEFIVSKGESVEKGMSLMRYQLSSTTIVPPVSIKMAWKVDLEKGWIGIVLRYSIPATMVIKKFQLSIPLDHTIVSVQSKPFEGVRSTDDTSYVIDVGGLSSVAGRGGGEEQKILVRLMSSRQVLDQGLTGLWTIAQSVGVTFESEQCVSRMSIEIDGVEKGDITEESRSGRYLVYA